MCVCVCVCVCGRVKAPAPPAPAVQMEKLSREGEPVHVGRNWALSDVLGKAAERPAGAPRALSCKAGRGSPDSELRFWHL